MKKPMTAAALLLTTTVCAQNLVPNGSFEEYIDCPPSFSFINSVVGWSGYSNSVDYLDTCAFGTVVSVPFSALGYQYAADGGGYAGIITYEVGDPLYREIFGCHLTQALQPGIPLCLSFKIAVGGFGFDPAGSVNHTCKGVGMRFLTFDPTIESVTNNLLNSNIAALHLDVVPTDTAIWYTVSGTYIPDSAYTVLLIGNFFNDSLSTPMLLDSTGYGTFPGAYVFIDDVRVSYQPGFCDLTTGAGSMKRLAPRIWPNPVGAELNISLAGGARGPLSLDLFTMDGRSVASWKMNPSNTMTLNFSQIRSGYYLLQTSDESGAYPAIPLVHLEP